MKKHISFLRLAIIILSLSLSITHSVYAWEEDCAIKSSMSPELASYIKTTESLLSLIREQASDTQCSKDPKGESSAMGSLNEALSVSVGATNSVLGFSNFFTSVEFFTLPLLGSPPPAIMRDHERLAKELEYVHSSIDMVYEHCAGNNPLSKPLSEEDTAYNVTGGTLGEVLTEVLKNQINIMNVYRSTVIGSNMYSPKLFLVGDSDRFYAQLDAHYGKTAWYGGKCESNAGMEMKAALKRMQEAGSGMTEGIDEWEKAIRLMNSDNEETKDTEKRVLKEELSRQGLSTESSDAIMANLENYNDNYGKEGVLGFVKSLGSRMSSSVGQIGKVFSGMMDRFTKQEDVPGNQKKLSTDAVMDKKDEINRAQAILTEISMDYTEMQAKIWLENQNTDEIIAKLMDTHIILEDTNRKVRESIKIAEHVCNSQSTGDGNCHY